ncbi:MAG: hypothetical protein ACYCXK_00855 [Candidatus Humimicrobiaceae bacterium]
MRPYKMFSIATAAIFAVVGLIFLIFPDWPLIFFNSISGYFRLPEAPLQGKGFYLILTSAYMYLVTLLAILMYRNPSQKIYPLLLAHGKLASSILSLYLFLIHQHYLIYIANFLVDGLIGIAALCLMKKIKKDQL